MKNKKDEIVIMTDDYMNLFIHLNILNQSLSLSLESGCVFFRSRKPGIWQSFICKIYMHFVIL